MGVIASQITGNTAVQQLFRADNNENTNGPFY